MKRSEVVNLIEATKKAATKDGSKKATSAAKSAGEKNEKREEEKKIEPEEKPVVEEPKKVEATEEKKEEPTTSSTKEEELSSALVEVLEIVRSYVASLAALKSDFESDKAMVEEKKNWVDKNLELVVTKQIQKILKDNYDKKLNHLLERVRDLDVAMNRVVDALLKKSIISN